MYIINGIWNATSRKRSLEIYDVNFGIKHSLKINPRSTKKEKTIERAADAVDITDRVSSE